MAQEVVTGGGVQKISGHCGAVGQQGTLGPVWHLESTEALTSLN